MHTPEAVAAMDGAEFRGQVLSRLDRERLEFLLTYLHGYSPEGMAAALNLCERLYGAAPASAS